MSFDLTDAYIALEDHEKRLAGIEAYLQYLIEKKKSLPKISNDELNNYLKELEKNEKT